MPTVRFSRAASAFAIASLLAAATATSGAIITYSDTRTLSGSGLPAGETQPFAIPQFNPALGTLTGVTVNLDGHLNSQLAGENKSTSSVGRFKGQLDGDGINSGSISVSYGATPLSSSTILLKTPNYDAGGLASYIQLGIFDGTIDYSGTSGTTYVWNTVNLTPVAQSYTLAPDLANFTGVGSAPLSANAGYNATISTLGGNVQTSMSTVSIFNASVTYDFIPVPEPASLALLAVAAIPLLSRRRKV